MLDLVYPVCQAWFHRLEALSRSEGLHYSCVGVLRTLLIWRATIACHLWRLTTRRRSLGLQGFRGPE